jgi:DNA-binding transcriptional regulator YbjK
MRVRTVAERTQAVEQLVDQLLEREALDDLNLNPKLEGLATRESSPEHREATLEAEHKALEDARVMVFSCELTTEIKETNLKTQVAELEEREKRLVGRQMRELAVAQKILYDLLASRAGEA